MLDKDKTAFSEVNGLLSNILESTTNQPESEELLLEAAAIIDDSQSIGMLLEAAGPAQGEWSGIQAKLLKMYSKAKKEKKLDFYEEDRKQGISEITRMIKSADDKNIRAKHRSHLNWCKTTAKKAIESRRKEIQNGKK